MNYDPTIYAGCAAHYVRGRPPYSRELPQAFAERLNLRAGSRLLDVGAGPGSVAIALQTLFDDIVALEPDPEMVAAGRRWTGEAGVGQLRYVTARAEALGELGLGQFDLVTFGQSFHWMARAEVAVLAFVRVAPAGGIAVITHRHLGRPQPPGPGVPMVPHDDIHALVRNYLGPKKRAGAGAPPEITGFDEEAVFEHVGFEGAERFWCAGRDDLVVDVDAVISSFLSMSFAAPPLFGDRLGAFISDARGLLLEHSPTGQLWYWPGDTEVVFARKPPHPRRQ